MRKTALLAAVTASFLIAPFSFAQETQPETPAPTEKPAPAPAPSEQPVDAPAPAPEPTPAPSDGPSPDAA